MVVHQEAGRVIARWRSDAVDGESLTYELRLRQQGTTDAVDLQVAQSFADITHILKSGTSYSVTVRAINRDGVASAFSSPTPVQVARSASGVPPERPIRTIESDAMGGMPPTRLATPASLDWWHSLSVLSLDWSSVRSPDSGQVMYEVRVRHARNPRSTAMDFEVSDTRANFDESVLQPDHVYEFTVRAVTGTLIGAFSDPVTVHFCPVSPDDMYALGSTFRSDSDKLRAREWLFRAASMGHLESIVLLWREDLIDQDQAADLLEVAADGGNSDAFFLRGQLALGEDPFYVDIYDDEDDDGVDEDTAIFWLSKAAGAGDIDGVTQLGRIALRQRDYAGAMQWLSHEDLLDPPRPEVMRMRGEAEAGLGRMDAARMWFLKSLDSACGNRDTCHAWMALGDLAASVNDHAEAAKWYEEVLAAAEWEWDREKAREKLDGLTRKTRPDLQFEAHKSGSRFRTIPAQEPRPRDRRVPLLDLPDAASDSVSDSDRSQQSGNPTDPAAVLSMLVADPYKYVRRALAQNLSVPTWALATLVDDAEEDVRSALAERVPLPAEIAEILVRDPDVYVRGYIASNPSTPEALLDWLADDTDSSVRRELATNPSLPDGMLVQLAQDKDAHVRAIVAGNPSVSAECLVSLSSDAEFWVRDRVAEHPKATPDVLRKLAKDRAEKVAVNPGTPSDVLTALARDGYSSIREAVAGNPAASADCLTFLEADDDAAVRAALARNPSTPVEVLQRLAWDPIEDVRDATLANHALPRNLSEILERPNAAWVISHDLALDPDDIPRIARDPNPYVRRCAAEHEPCPEQVLAQLAADSEAVVRKAVADNPATAPEVLERLAVEDLDKHVREAVARNAATEPAVLEILALDPKKVVREAAATNPAASVEVFQELVSDEKAAVRERVAKRAPWESVDLQNLVTDRSDAVRASLASNPSIPALVWVVLASDESNDVREAAAGNPSIGRFVGHDEHAP